MILMHLGKNEISFADKIRHHDPDRFIAATLLPYDHFKDAVILLAFYHEIAEVRDKIRDPLLGQMRLQWWHDMVERCFTGKSVSTPLLTALQSLIAKGRTEQHLYHDLISARMREITGINMQNLHDLHFFAKDTNAPLQTLLFQIGGFLGAIYQNLAESIARIWALIGLLRATPFYLQTGQCLLPKDLLADHNIRMTDLNNPRDIEKLAPIILTCLDSLAPDYLYCHRQLALFSDKSLMRYCGWLPLAISYDRQIRKFDGNVFDPAFRQKPAGRLIRLFLCKYFHAIPNLAINSAK